MCTFNCDTRTCTTIFLWARGPLPSALKPAPGSASGLQTLMVMLTVIICWLVTLSSGNGAHGPHLGAVRCGFTAGVSARGDGVGEASSCAKRLRLPGPKDSLPGGPRAWPSCAPELCADPGFRLFRKGEELMGVWTIREALCARMLSYSDPLSPA